MTQIANLTIQQRWFEFVRDVNVFESDPTPYHLRVNPHFPWTGTRNLIILLKLLRDNPDLANEDLKRRIRDKLREWLSYDHILKPFYLHSIDENLWAVIDPLITEYIHWTSFLDQETKKWERAFDKPQNPIHLKGRIQTLKTVYQLAKPFQVINQPQLDLFGLDELTLQLLKTESFLEPWLFPQREY